MFYSSPGFNNDISSWDVSAVTTMQSMFKEASQFGQKLCELNIGEDTSVGGMFADSKCTVADCV